MQAEHLREISQLEADLTQFMNDKTELENRVTSLQQNQQSLSAYQPECSYRSNVSQQTNQKLLKDEQDYLKTVVFQLEE